jgi:hypothetical protein
VGALIKLSSRCRAVRRFGTNDNQLTASLRFGHGAIFTSVVIAIPALISAGLLATSNIDLKPHREIIDIHKYPWPSIGKISVMGYSSGQLCTGAVIGPNLFLTAAHCLYNIRTARFMSASLIHILIDYENGEYRANRVASQYTIPPALDPSVFTYRPDPKKLWAAASYWAIVYTDEPFPLDVRPLRLASTIPSLGTAVMIGGYRYRAASHDDGRPKVAKCLWGLPCNGYLSHQPSRHQCVGSASPRGEYRAEFRQITATRRGSDSIRQAAKYSQTRKIINRPVRGPCPAVRPVRSGLNVRGGSRPPPSPPRVPGWRA